MSVLGWVQARAEPGRVAGVAVRLLRLTREALVVGVPAVSVAVSYSNVLSGSSRAVDVVVGTALAVVVAIMLLLRRRWPLAVTAGVAASYLLDGSVVLAVLAALLSLAVRGSWQRVAVGSGVVLAAFLAQQTRYGADVETVWQQPGGVVVGVLGIASAASCGLYVGARRQLLVQALERARRAEAEQDLRDERARVRERSRIAREMHDVLAHRLSMLSLHAGALEYRADITGGEVAEAAAVVRANAHEALQDLRDVLGVLRADAEVSTTQVMNGACTAPGDVVATHSDVVATPEGPGSGDSNGTDISSSTDEESSTVDDSGDESLAGGLRPPPTMRDLAALVDEVSALGAQVTLWVSSAATDSTATVQRAVYRVVQEGLTNAGKHAPGAPVRVEVAVEDARVHVVVQNQPAPWPRPVVAPLALDGTGSGLVGVVERVALLGGWVEQGPCSGGGWVLRVSIPKVPKGRGGTVSADEGSST